MLGLFLLGGNISDIWFRPSLDESFGKFVLVVLVISAKSRSSVGDVLQCC
jgi:hypothetical protein